MFALKLIFDGWYFNQVNTISNVLKLPEVNIFRNSLNLGMHTISDQFNFIKIMNLIRFISKNPYGFESSKLKSLYEYYINNLDNCYMPSEVHSLRKDIQNFMRDLAGLKRIVFKQKLMKNQFLIYIIKI